MRTSTTTLFSIIAFLALAPPAGAQALGPAPVSLGAAGSYAVLAKTAVSTVPASVITGNVGISPAAATFITGFSLTHATGYATSPQVTGRVYAADMASPTPANLTTAVSNMETAFTDAAGRPGPNFVELYVGNLGGKVLTPGLYKWSGTVTAPTSFSIAGGPNDIWIFQIAGDLSLSSNVNVTLSGGAQARNIFWQVSGAVSIGTNAHFEGIILAKTAIHLLNGASLNGRALAQTAVTLDMNTVTAPAGPSTGNDAVEAPRSETLRLSGSYPNPFSGATHIGFSLSEPAMVRLEVYDLLGRAVAEIASAPLPAGAHALIWEAGAAPRGLYVYRLSANGVVRTGRVTLLGE